MSVLEGQASEAFPRGDPMTQEGKAISEQIDVEAGDVLLTVGTTIR
jgi:hypothetical protein